MLRGRTQPRQIINRLIRRNTNIKRFRQKFFFGRLKAKVLQQALTDLGFEPGPVDGQPGRKTREALAEFFEASGREPVQGDEAVISLVKHQWEQSRPRYDLF